MADVPTNQITRPVERLMYQPINQPANRLPRWLAWLIYQAVNQSPNLLPSWLNGLSTEQPINNPINCLR